MAEQFITSYPTTTVYLNDPLRDSRGRFASKYAHHKQYRDSNGRFVTQDYAEKNPQDVRVTKWKQPRKQTQ